ncbi:MAG: HAMP domain-containing sensor histidine kinase, partial [Planctomycetota bacterium]
MRLALKFILLFVSAVVLVTAFASYFTNVQFLRNTQKQHAEIAASITPKIKSLPGEDSPQFGNNDLERIIRSARNDIPRTRWVWLGNEVPTHLQPTLTKPKPNDCGLNENLSHSISLAGENRQGTPTYFSYFPIKIGGQQGAIEISSPLASIRIQSTLNWKSSVYSVLSIGLLTIGLVMILGVRWIASPLQKLTHKMEQVGRGDFSSNLQLHSNDELGELGKAVNLMCDRLREQQRTIETETNQRIAALEQLRHADRLKTVGQLAAGFAHEVGTPLNVISGRAEMILGTHESNRDQIEKHARAIKDESERISQIIRKLLDFARRSPVKKEQGDLREVIQRSIEMIRPLTEKKEVLIRTDLPAKKALVHFDFNQFQQVLMNLVGNAVDASQPGQTVEVILKKRTNDNRWAIQVIDHGKGIPESSREEIFQPFFTTK